MRSWLIGLAGFAGMQVALAQAPSPLEIVQSFQERFDGSASVPVKGGTIMGVAIGRGRLAFDPDAVRVSLPPLQPADPVCLGIFSRDGRYEAENLYRSRSATSGLAGFTLKSRYTDKLRQYESQAVAVLIRRTDLCNGTDPGVILPARSIRAQDTDRLFVFVNAAPGRTSAYLLPGQGDPIKGSCAAAADGSVGSAAFSTICEIGLPPDPDDRRLRLKVTIQERFDASEVVMPIQLGPPA